MSEINNCPKCGADLPTNAPAGICPKCLLAAGLESESTVQPNADLEAPTIDSPARAGFVPPAVSELADRFPQLEILELLGFGGMGAVYKARQTNLDRLVALKIIRPEATQNSTFAERFNREAKALARLSHQHIVTIHDFGEVEFSDATLASSRPLYFFVMEYVDGVNLRHLMQAGELTPEQALAIVPQICDALQYAHDEGVVHRDIKPENILIDRRGRVKIADYGLAKLASRSDEEFTLTGTHQVMGTVRYMAPEQMEASHTVDHRADIYSLGVVFYEMLTGEVPAGHFDPPSRKVVIDVRLDEVVMRSLARDPERRYQHASDVKTDVELCGTAAPVSSATNIGRDVQSEKDSSSSAVSLQGSFGSRFGWREYSGYAVFTLFMLLFVSKSVFQQPISLTCFIGVLVSIAVLSLLAYVWERRPFVPTLPWYHQRNWIPVVAPFMMLFILSMYFDRESVAAWHQLSGETAGDADGLLQRIAYFGLNLWTILYAGAQWTYSRRSRLR